VTGATSAVGGAILRRLWADPAWAGVHFLLAGRRAAPLESLCAEGAALGFEARPGILDLEDGRGLAAAAPWFAGLPPLGGLLLAAGKTGDQTIARADAGTFDSLWRVNTGFHATLIRSLGAPGRLAPGARGLLVGSLSGLRGNAGQAAYAAAKGALVDLLRLAPPGLRLNLLLPPLVPSPLLDALSPAARARLYSRRLMDDPDPAAGCAEAAAFLLSDGASYIHRQVLHADSRVTALGWD